ncbi:MAG: DUF4835 family protein [Flavobacteriaceae bacterium]|nr:DUF4835 family protein [Flavobacteriaceae bacterium]
MNKILLYIFIIFSFTSFGQELNCNVVVNATQTGDENLQIFKTLENQISDFINNTNWTKNSYTSKQRINCSMVINISNYDNNIFQGTIQIQSSRPIFNSSYESTVYNYIDKDFSFEYQEFQNFIFNSNQFESNLISVLSFHVYIILGIDSDTFELNSGKRHYQQARSILDYSSSTNYLGWNAKDGRQNRYYLIDNILSPTFKEFSNVLYNYHLNGLDKMYDDTKKSKLNISKSIISLERINSRRPNSYIMKVFFDTKADEIQDIFSDGPSVEITNLSSTLSKLAPMHSSKWRKIKF